MWRRVLLLLPAVSCVFVLLGCRNRGSSALDAAHIHAITREMQYAAASALQARGHVYVYFSADDASPYRPDRISITLEAGGRSVSSSGLRRQRIDSAAVVQALDRVATAQGLVRNSSPSGTGAGDFSYRSGTRVTQVVRLVLTPAARRGPSASWPNPGAGGAQLAIILDDLGGDEAAAQRIFALPYPLTLSVLPGHAHSAQIAEEAHSKGYEVMLHLPMEAQGREHPEPAELHPGMPQQEVASQVAQFLGGVPYADGVNNHQGSQATSDAQLMAALMPVLRERNLFYVDSRTTVATVAYDTARQDGVRAAFRNVPFLDDVADRGAIRKQLELAFRGAQSKGQAVAIGHPHPETLAALREMLPQAAGRGVRLVFVSQVVH